MDANLTPLIDRLEVQIDDLRDALEPLLVIALSHSAAKLPLLDKAKLYVLVTYAIESLLFSILKLDGVNSREHPVFRELTRVKQYFEKIKHVEQSGIKRDNLSLDKEAANRFIKHALAGNEKYDLKRAEQQAKERAKAHIKFSQLSKKRKAVDDESASSESSESDESSGSTKDKSPTDDADQIRKRRRKDSSIEDIRGTEEGNEEKEGGNMIQLSSTRGDQPLSERSADDHTSSKQESTKRFGKTRKQLGTQ
ncbi:MAG: hypothetical protein M1813_006355 [Trichoglossum hirsutum]|nr:MAG: hypothetical protein M1813_006355 [Trichoglossum hirsutum]